LKVDVAVVGGGALGLSIAYNVAKRGLKTMVFEANYLGFGSTGRDIGLVRERVVDDVAKLALMGLKMHDKLPDKLGVNTLFRRSGCLIVALEEEEAKALEEKYKAYKRMGVQCDPLRLEEVKKRFPYVNVERLKACYYDKREGLVHPLALLWAYFEAFKKVGGALRKQAKVKSLKVEGGSFRVATDAETVEARKVVIAAGVYSSELAKQVGLTVPVEPLAREALVTEPMKPFLGPVIERPSNGFLLGQTMRGEFIGTIGSLGRSYDLSLSSYSFLKEFSRQAVEIVPALSGLKILRQWTWICDTTPDGKPLIGETSVNGLYLACGCHDYGLSIIPAIGELLGRLIVGGEVDPLIKPFSPARF